MKIARYVGIAAVGIAGLAVAGVFLADMRRASLQESIDREWEQRESATIGDLGSTARLSVTPIVNWHANDPRFLTEPGVSYLVETDDRSILFDLGFNRHAASPSPLEHNLAVLGRSMAEMDMIFISHMHRDHIGGAKWEERRSFGTGLTQPRLGAVEIFAPEPIEYPGKDPIHVDAPRKLADGVASTGPIARQLFVGRIEEQALVVNLEGKGLVLIVGCGHQTVQRLVELVEEEFDQPLYAIVGDLHYPVPQGRLWMAGIDVQRRLASGDGVFSPLGERDVDKLEELLVDKFTKVVLGGHDTNDTVLDRIAARFGERFKAAAIGETITFGE